MSLSAATSRLQWKGHRQGLDWFSTAAARLGFALADRRYGAVYIVGIAAALTVVVWQVPSNLQASPPLIQLSALTVPMLFVVAGAIGISHRRESPVGPLLVVSGLLNILGRLQGADPPIVWLAANLANSAWQVVVFYVYFSFPLGRLRSPVDVALVWAGLVYTMANNLFVLLTTPARPAPGLSTANPLFLPMDAHLHGEVRQLLLVAGYALILGGAAWLFRRWLSASRPMRRALTPVYLAALGTSATAILLRLVLGVVSPTTNTSQVLSVALLIAYALVPIAFLAGLLRARMSRAAIAELVLEIKDLPPVDRLRDALARALGDPELRLLGWSPERDAYVDPSGEELTEATVNVNQAVTLLEREGKPVLAVVHDPSLLDDPGLVPAVATAVRLTVDNRRLEDAVEAQLAEVRASRTRIVEASDDARRRVERDLHDGAQQRLLAISLALRMTRERLSPEGAAEVGAKLDDLAGQLAVALAELRELAHGVHPAVLTEYGLVPAIRSLALNSLLPVEIQIDLSSDRLPPAVETTTYFVVAESLANAAKYARASKITVVLAQNGDRLRVEVRDNGEGGADPLGAGLRGLTDRVAALGGTLEITNPSAGGTLVQATLPCA